MDKKTATSICVIFALILGLFIAVSAYYLKNYYTLKVTFVDSAAALAFITASAVAIERTIETFWTVLGGIKGSYWPLQSITKQVDTLVNELDISLKPFHETIQQKISALKEKGQIAEKDAAEAIAEVQRLKLRFDELKNLAPDNQRVQLLTAAANQNVNYIFEKYGKIISGLDTATSIANTSINGLQDFLSTFKDNPGRRLISIFIGAILGLTFSTAFGLDIFKAVLESSSGTTKISIAGIIFTGLIIGLGSNPTHEVIRALQEYKKTRKGANIATPNLPNRP